jgi:hypothetical protein
MHKMTWNSFLRVEATQLLDVPRVSEDFALLVCQLIRVELEHLDDDVGPFPRR